MAFEKYRTTDINDNPLPTAIDFTTIVAEDSKKKVGSVVGRAAIGSFLLGPVGLLAGASGKNNRTTTFMVRKLDGTSKNVTVYTDSIAFENLCKYLR